MADEYSRQRLEAAQRELVRRADRALDRVAESVLGEAVRDAPVDEGTLRASGAVSSPYPRPPVGVLERIISFGLVYAAVQHENLNYRHPKGGKAKYLEDAVKRCRLPHLLAQEMRREPWKAV